MIPIELLGRASELTSLRGLIESARLVTVLGPPGVGKTTLARALIRELDRPALLVELGGASEGIEPLLRRALPGEPDVTLAEALVAASAHGPLLLVLDEAERVVDELAALIPSLLTCPALTVVVTSRVRLRLRDEVAFDLPPLEPEAACELFSTLAARTYRHYQPDLQVVRELVERLDFLPLAIELAAARCRAMSPRELLARMDQRFALLRTRMQDHASRFRNLEDAIRFSFDALDGEQQAALSRLAVFGSTFAAEAAEAVIASPRASELLEELLDASLVHRTVGPDVHGSRFRLLDSIRAFAGSELSPDARRDAEARHARHFVELAEALATECERPDGIAALDRLALERDEIELAHARMVEREPVLATRITLALAPLALARGPLESHEHRLDAALAAVTADTPPRTRLRLHLERGTSRFMRARVDAAMQDLTTACSLTDAVGDLGLTDRARTTMMLAAQWGGQPVITGERASTGAATRAPFVSFSAGLLALHSGDLEAAVGEAERGRAHAAQLSDRMQLARLTALCGLLAVECDDFARGRTLYLEAEQLFTQTRDANFMAIAGLWRALFTLEVDGASAGSDAIAAARHELKRLGMVLFEASANGYQSIALLQAGDFAAALAASDRALPPLRLVGDAYRLTNFLAARVAICAGLGNHAEADRARAERAPWLAHPINPNLPVCAAIYDTIADALARRPVTRAPSSRREISSDVRLALAAARALAPQLLDNSPATCLRIGADHTLVRIDDGALIDLRRRRPLVRILSCLVARHRQCPGAPVSTAELVAAGWPGERMLPESGAQRVWAAIATLRKLGLRDVVVRTGTGYQLLADVRLELLDERATS